MSELKPDEMYVRLKRKTVKKINDLREVNKNRTYGIDTQDDVINRLMK